MMGKFLFIEYQHGGCDYTIGCGVRVSNIIEADTPPEALDKFIQRFEDDYRENGILYGNPWDGEYRPNNLEMYEITTEHEVDFAAIRQRAQDEIDHREVLEKEAAERAEFERLKQKFE